MIPKDIPADKIKKLLQGVSIPPQPQIMVDLQMEQLDDDCSIAAIGKLILQDVGLSGSILKTINSPFFGLVNKVTSINQAISLLGIDTVINIVNSLSIRSCLSDEEIVQMTRFWDSAMDIAQASAEISRTLKLGSPDEAYMTGLFHNCGNILMLQKFSNFASVMESSYTHEHKRIIDIENEEFSTNHSVVGYYVSKAWHLPRHVCDVIAQHHSAESIFEEENLENTDQNNLLAILKVAEHLCGNYRVLGNASQDHEWHRLESNILRYLDLSDCDFDAIKADMEDLGITHANYIDFAR